MPTHSSFLVFFLSITSTPVNLLRTLSPCLYYKWNTKISFVSIPNKDFSPCLYYKWNTKISVVSIPNQELTRDSQLISELRLYMRWNSLHLSKLILFLYQLAKYFICNTNTVESLPLTFVKNKGKKGGKKGLKRFQKGNWKMHCHFFFLLRYFHQFAGIVNYFIYTLRYICFMLSNDNHRFIYGWGWHFSYKVNSN